MNDDDAGIIRREQDWYLTRLRDIPGERAALAKREHDLVHGARTAGISWDDIAAAIGTTADAALDQYGEPEPGADPF